MSYTATLECNGLRCSSSISADGASCEVAATTVQERALAASWSVAADRLYSDRDFCPRCCTRPSERGTP